MCDSEVMPARLDGPVRRMGAVRPGIYQDTRPLPLVQAWEAPGQVPREPAVAYAGITGTHLCFYVWMQDGHCFTHARRDNERLWTLGDTVEFFIKPGVRRKDYWEIHVAPNSTLMDIHIPERTRFMAGRIPWSKVVSADSGAERRVWVSPRGGAWAVELRVPFAAFGKPVAPAPGTRWQFAVCRYNYTGSLDTLEYSATAPFTKLSYHRYEEYHDLVFP